MKLLLLRFALLAGVCVGVLPVAPAVEPAFDAKGITSLRVGGNNLLQSGRPQLKTVVFETTALDGKGIKKYTFETLSGVGKLEYRANTKTSTETFEWGTVAVVYRPAKDRLDLIVTVTNRSTRTLADFDIELGTFAFPTEPTGWKGGRGSIATGLDNLALTKVEIGSNRFVVCNANPEVPCRLGFGPAVQKGKQSYPLVVRGGVSAAEPGASVLDPHGLPRVPPGKSLTLEITIRNSPANGKTSEVLADVYSRFATANKSTLSWSDRRPIGTIFHSSPAKQHQSKTNPRGWLNNPKLDVVSPAGKAAFRTEMLKAARQGVEVITKTGGQGMIFWDLEGQENPHPISFIGDPTMVKRFAPEMDEIADEYFKVYRDAGLRTGVTLRPSQVFFDEAKKKWDHNPGNDGGEGRGEFYTAIRPKDVPWYKFYPVAERLSDRIAYAKKRWGCTLFYVDTNGTFRQVGEAQKFTWFLLQADVFKRLRELHPDVLIIPELPKDNQTYHAAYWAHTAQYFEVDMKGYRTPSYVRELLPNAFSVVNVADGDLDKNRAEIKSGVASGDVLMFRGWFHDKRNDWVKTLYEEVKKEKK